MGLLICIGIVVLLGLYLLVTYNGLIKLRNSVKEAFSTMDVYLKKRWDLIPNVVETVKGYAEHEKSTFENITNLRNTSYDNMNTSEKIATNKKMSDAISRLMMIVENYPELKANQNFSELSSQLSKVEEDIANARKYYNAVVKKMNNKVEIFPSNIVAKLFDFKQAEMFEADASNRENVNVEF